MKDYSKKLFVEHVSKEQLKEEIRELEKVAKKVKRLQFIQELYNGHTVKEASEILDLPLKTCYNWLKKWNEKGLEGLNHKKGAGRPSFLSNEELKQVNEYIQSNDDLNTTNIHNFIKKNFNIDYSLKQVRIIIKKLGYNIKSP